METTAILTRNVLGLLLQIDGDGGSGATALRGATCRRGEVARPDGDAAGGVELHRTLSLTRPGHRDGGVLQGLLDRALAGLGLSEERITGMVAALTEIVNRGVHV